MIGKVLAGVRDVLLIVVLTAVIVMGVLFINALRETASKWQEPAPAACIVRDSSDPSRCLVTG